MGKRVNLADLADSGALDVARVTAAEVPPTTVAVHRVAANPLNPRQDLGDLTELTASLKTVGQLQPCTVVTRAAYLAQYPEHEAGLGGADYVAIMGSRRRAAAEAAGLSTLDVMVKDALATSRESLATAAVIENIERLNFDVIEEAHAISTLVTMLGSGARVAEYLTRTTAWVSQRLSLLKLTTEMQALVRDGTIPVRDARRLGSLPADEQLPAWRAEQQALKESKKAAPASALPSPTLPTGTESPTTDITGFTKVTEAPRQPSVVVSSNGRSAGDHPPAESAEDPARARPHAKPSEMRDAVRRLGATPDEIAQSLRAHLEPATLKALAELLQTRP